MNNYIPATWANWDKAAEPLIPNERTVQEICGTAKKPSNPLASQVSGDHYKNSTIQPVEFIQANDLGFIEGNIVKYICRYEQKGGSEDLDKIIHYVQLLKELKYGADA